MPNTLWIYVVDSRRTQGVAKHLLAVLVVPFRNQSSHNDQGEADVEMEAACGSLGAIPPILLKTAENPEGIDGAVFDEIKTAVVKDRPAYFKAFLDNFYNVDVLGGTRISEQDVEARQPRP